MKITDFFGIARFPKIDGMIAIQSMIFYHLFICNIGNGSHRTTPLSILSILSCNRN